MKNRDYKLYCGVQFLLNRKNFLEAATTESEKGLLQEGYNKALLELKEILNITDTCEVLAVYNDKIVIPKKYYSQSVALFRESKVRGYLGDNTTILIK